MLDLVAMFVFMQGLWSIDVAATSILSSGNSNLLVAEGLFGMRKITVQYHIGLMLCTVIFFGTISLSNLYVLKKMLGE